MIEHLLDTGPLVALVDSRDRDHAWSSRILGRLTAPPILCEAVLTEALYLLRSDPAAPQKIGTLFASGWLVCRPLFPIDAGAVFALMQSYRDVPMSLADACLVRLSEKLDDPAVITLDSDFKIYRRHRNQAIPVLSPRR